MWCANSEVHKVLVVHKAHVVFKTGWCTESGWGTKTGWGLLDLDGWLAGCPGWLRHRGQAVVNHEVWVLY